MKPPKLEVSDRVKALMAGAKAMSPALTRRVLQAKEADRHGHVQKPVPLLKANPVKLNPALVPRKASDTLKGDPRQSQPGLNALERPDL